jgi:hypothetical protein
MIWRKSIDEALYVRELTMPLSKIVEKLADEFRKLYGVDIAHMSGVLDCGNFDVVTVDGQKIKYPGKPANSSRVTARMLSLASINRA